MRKCNYAIDEASQGPVTEEEDPTLGAEATCFFHTSTSKFVALTIVSFGLWQVYWLYRNWRYLRDNGRRGISPFWRSVFDAKGSMLGTVTPHGPGSIQPLDQ